MRTARRHAATREGGVRQVDYGECQLSPLLQTQKLLDSVLFARRKGHKPPLTATELEVMNLTGEPPEFRQVVPTANFFQQSGYERNPVALNAKGTPRDAAGSVSARQVAAIFNCLATAAGKNH
jgi:hypothetical protein